MAGALASCFLPQGWELGEKKREKRGREGSRGREIKRGKREGNEIARE